MEEILKVYEAQHLDPPWSHIVVWSLNALAILAAAWCIRELLGARRATAMAERMEMSTSSLYEGARFVAGYVELAHGQEAAVHVTILQEGTQTQAKRGWSHKWTEIQRDVFVTPFYLRMANGDRVRVEPPVDVMLVDKLDQIESLTATKRQRRAELTPNEYAVIEGRLERGADPELQSTSTTYRNAVATGWVMKPDKRRGMSVSTESLSRRHELRAQAFGKVAVWVLLSSLGALLVPWPYYTRLVLGRNVYAEYRGKETYIDMSGKKRRNAYGVLVSYEDPAYPERSYISRNEISHRDFPRLPTTKDRYIWLRYVPGRDWATCLGRGTSVHALSMIASTYLVAVAFFITAGTWRRRRWYENHLIDVGAGPLPDPLKSRFRVD